MVPAIALASLLVSAGGSASSTLVQETLAVEGYNCPGAQTAWVVRPDDNGQYPLVSFAHGYGSGGDKGVKDYYSDLITGIAGMGYVVVALESASGMCTREYKDQLHSLAWALGNSDLIPHIDQAAGTALVGQSMGGGSTVMASSQAETSIYNVKTALAIHPCLSNCGLSLSDVDPKVPILLLTGDLDDVIVPESVYEQYNKTSGVEKAFAEIKGATHCDCCDDPYGDRIETPYIYDWLNCKMKGDSAACTLVATCTEPNITFGEYGCHYLQAAGLDALV